MIYSFFGEDLLKEETDYIDKFIIPKFGEDKGQHPFDWLDNDGKAIKNMESLESRNNCIASLNCELFCPFHNSKYCNQGCCRQEYILYGYKKYLGYIK